MHIQIHNILLYFHFINIFYSISAKLKKTWESISRNKENFIHFYADIKLANLLFYWDLRWLLLLQTISPSS